jgi:hypothetical protein
VSLANKLIFVIISIIAVTVSLMTYNRVVDERAILNDALQKRLILLSENLKQNAKYTIEHIAADIENDLASMNLLDITTQLEALVKREGIVGATLINKKDESSKITKGVFRREMVQSFTIQEKDNYVIVAMPIYLSEYWGSVNIVYSTQKLEQERKKSEQEIKDQINNYIESATITSLFVTLFF